MVLVAGLLLRAWPWLAQPLLALEDGAFFFATSYAEWEMEAATKPYAGYVPFGTNVLSMLLCRLPTEWIPTAFVVAAASMTFGCAATFLRPAWQVVAPFRVRVLLSLVLVMVPFGSNLEFTSLAYAQWPQMLWLFLLMVEPPVDGARSSVSGAVRGFWVAFLALINPLSVLLLPLGLLPTVRHAGRWDWSCLIGAVISYWLLVWLFVDDLVTAAFGSVWLDLVPVIGVHVIVEALVGVGGAQALADAGTPVLGVVATLLGVSVVVVVVLAWPRWTSAARVLVVACI